jgi:nucleoid-associated protein YgaU
MAAETPAYQPVQQTADTTPPANALPAAPYTPPAASPPTAAAPQYDIYGRDVAGETSPAGTLPPSTASRGASAAPQSPQTEQAYTIAPNDSFWTIAQAVYGSGGYFKALEAYNAPRFPNSSQLAVGATIALPPASVLEQKFPDLCPKPRQSPAARGTMLQASTRLTGGTQGRIYTVQRGDTLFDIARYELGKAARWSEIYELNRDRLGNDFDFLAPGMELILPNNATEPAARTTQAQPPFNR